MPERAPCPSCDEGESPIDSPCCALEAVVSVDERGQLVLPKDLRVRAGISAGDRLALISYRGEDGDICCLTLVNTQAVAGAVQSVISPVLRATVPTPGTGEE